MSGSGDKLDRLIHAISAGDARSIDEDEVRQLEEMLNASEQEGAALRETLPPRDQYLRPLLEQIDQKQAPSAEQWEAVQRTLEQAARVRAMGSRGKRPRLIRLYVGISAAAACLLLGALSFAARDRIAGWFGGPGPDASGVSGQAGVRSGTDGGAAGSLGEWARADEQIAAVLRQLPLGDAVPVLAFQPGPGHESEGAWPLQLSSGVEIENLEVHDGSTAFVVAGGGEDGFEVIWVLEEEPDGDNNGAMRLLASDPTA